MGVTGIVVGSIMGLTTKLGSNVLQKVPYMRRTYLHRSMVLVVCCLVP